MPFICSFNRDHNQRRECVTFVLPLLRKADKLKSFSPSQLRTFLGFIPTLPPPGHPIFEGGSTLSPNMSRIFSVMMCR